MDIIFGKANAEKLREKYTVLDLETITVETGELLDVYCVIPAEKINLGDMATLHTWIKLHHDFLHGYKTKQYNYCRQCMEHLRGKFGGELDTFYDELERRINEEEGVVQKKGKKKKTETTK